MKLKIADLCYPLKRLQKWGGGEEVEGVTCVSVSHSVLKMTGAFSQEPMSGLTEAILTDSTRYNYY